MIKKQETRNNEPISVGRVIQVLGPVVDVVFENYQPRIYEALLLGDLVLEVEQLLAGGRVRTVAMGPTEGLVRGSQVVATGAPITVPVGKSTLGRVFNVLGQ